MDRRVFQASAEDGFWFGPEKAIDGRLDGQPFSSKKAKFPWMSLELGHKPCRVKRAIPVKESIFLFRSQE